MYILIKRKILDNTEFNFKIRFGTSIFMSARNVAINVFTHHSMPWYEEQNATSSKTMPFEMYVGKSNNTPIILKVLLNQYK